MGTCDWAVPSWVASVRVLVVAGGGGGGVNGRGGGGGGGAYYGPAYLNGGYSQYANTVVGTNGGDSAFSALTSLGGGAGSGSYNPATPRVVADPAEGAASARLPARAPLLRDTQAPPVAAGAAREVLGRAGMAVPV